LTLSPIVGIAADATTVHRESLTFAFAGCCAIFVHGLVSASTAIGVFQTFRFHQSDDRPMRFGPKSDDGRGGQAKAALQPPE
jgi:hypothetical protein